MAALLDRRGTRPARCVRPYASTTTPRRACDSRAALPVGECRLGSGGLSRRHSIVGSLSTGAVRESAECGRREVCHRPKATTECVEAHVHSCTSRHCHATLSASSTQSARRRECALGRRLTRGTRRRVDLGTLRRRRPAQSPCTREGCVGSTAIECRSWRVTVRLEGGVCEWSRDTRHLSGRVRVGSTAFWPRQFCTSSARGLLRGRARVGSTAIDSCRSWRDTRRL